ncbi:MAG: hypothetical protein ACREI3_06220 [Nitrospirales bacterium]
MKVLVGSLAAVIGLAVMVSLAFANPDMLPKHPGYPAGKAVSPVTGQPLANDPGQNNAVGEKALAEAATFDKHVVTSDKGSARIVNSEGAGRLPKVEGPQIQINPPVKEATRMK